MSDQNPPQGRPDFRPPGENSAGPPVPPPAQPSPPPGTPAQPGSHPQFPPPAPPGGYPQFGAPASAKGRGSIWLGIGITITVLLVSWGLTAAVPYNSPLASVTNLLAAVLPFALVLGGIVMAAIPRTTRTGAGVLIGIGAGILIAGGLCFALVLGLGAFGG